MKRSPKDAKEIWKIWKSRYEPKPSKPPHYWERPEYWEESWRHEETFCHSVSSERQCSCKELARTIIMRKKWYMHNPAPILENDTNKFVWDFDIQTDHLISARRPDTIIMKKKKKKENLQNCGLYCPGCP